MQPSLRLPCALLAASLAACSSNNPPTVTDAGLDATALDTPAADAPVGDTSDAPTAPPRMCRPGTAWASGTPAYRVGDTAAWGLDQAQATGITNGDLDGDGYPDLIVWNQPPNVRSNFDATPAAVYVHVLMNRPRTGGAGRTFVETTRASHLLDIRGGGEGRVAQFVILGDVDNDGDLDAYTGVMPTAMPTAPTPADPGDRAEILLNDGHGVFHLAEPSQTTQGRDESPQTIGAVFTDQNLDGELDLFVGFQSQVFGLPIGQQHQLFHGAGDGAFTDVTTQVGIDLGGTMSSVNNNTNRRPLYGVSACDVNGDGRQDLIGAAYGRQFNLLFVSQGETFRDVSVASGVGGDMNQDYSDNLSYRCYCQTTPSACPAGIPAPPAGFCPGRGWRPGTDDRPWRLNGNGFSIACGDVDNDGDIDLYTGEITHPDVGLNSDRSELLVNQSEGETIRFDRPARASIGLAPPIARNLDEGGISNGMWDFDNDGRMDIWLGGSDYDGQYGWMFHQEDGGQFREIGVAGGFRHACPHGIALADFDLDGDVDAVMGSSTFRTFCNTQWHGRNELRFYENVAGDNNWTSVRLIGTGHGGANRNAVGARVRVTAGGVTQTRELSGAWGVSGLSAELVAHFGLAANCAIERLEVRWPDATTSVDTFTDIPANYRLEVRQGEHVVRYLTAP